ncbi:LysR family transcriptional regulator [Brevibacterium aurantiacum]|uniref:LysR family transcriptional regulator n=1 Tax=Brevibacterium aurantiacum TaxID=273384 RepID=A0A556C1E3_BREAU|nr:LysR family transcriptional regulator [Brevibacterium aurantiacum]TSI11285.1 LysR family transcriptional regulator [Brevibacterium aurantiacum]
MATFDTKRLEIFVQTVNTGSITAAADLLGGTTSGASQQLRRLEQETGQPLLRRRSRGVVPTEAGMILAAHARKILSRMDAAQADLDDLTHGRRGSLVIGAFPTVASSFLPVVIERFKSQYPSVTLSIRSTRLDQLVNDLERGQTHLSLLWDHPWRPLTAEGIRIDELFRESFVVLVSRHHRLADVKSVSMGDLAAESWVVRAQNHPVVEVLDRAATAAGFHPSIAMYANDYQEAQAMVSAGIGVALAPMSAVDVPHPGVQLLSLGEAAPVRRIMVGQREERVYSPAEMAFRTTLIESVKGRHQGDSTPPNSQY